MWEPNYNKPTYKSPSSLLEVNEPYFPNQIQASEKSIQLRFLNLPAMMQLQVVNTVQNNAEMRNAILVSHGQYD